MSRSPSSLGVRAGTTGWGSSSRAWATSTPSTDTQDDFRGGQGLTGGTGAVYKGRGLLSLHQVGSEYCAATAIETAVPPGAVKTTEGSCNIRAGQWEGAELSGNPGEQLGLATPSASPSAVSQGNTVSSEDSPS